MDELPEGTIVGGRYRIERLLGRGGMGLVYLAQHTSLHRAVALKMLLPRAASDGPAVARFLQEARAAAAIGHPGIVEVFDLSQPGETPYLAMEKLDGETLHERIARGALSAAELLQIAIPLCEAVGAAHAHGIVHRDLKPDNVFIAQPGARVKVLDFGIAKLATQALELSLTQTGQVLGTPNYMAPEQMRGRADARTDVYALGTIFYECLMGVLPFQATTITELISKITSDPAPPIMRADVPPHLAGLIAACLEKEPANRPPDARSLCVGLRVSTVAPTTPMAYTPSTPSPTPHRSRVLMLLGAAALAIPVFAIFGAAIAGLAWWAMPHAETPEPHPIPTAEPPRPPPPEDPPTRSVRFADASVPTITITIPGQQPRRPEIDHPATLAEASELEHRCIVAYATEVQHAHDEYYLWAEHGVDNVRRVGTVTALHDDGAACEAALAATPELENLRDLRSRTRAYATALRTLAPLINEASAYYGARTYETDHMERGRTLHQELVRAFEAYFPAEEPLRRAFQVVLQDEREERLKVVDQAVDVHTFQLEASRLAWYARGTEIQSDGSIYGPREIPDAIDCVERAHDELAPSTGAYRAQADAFLAAALALRARLRGRSRRGDRNSGSPARIVGAYDALLVAYYDTTGG